MRRLIPMLMTAFCANAQAPSGTRPAFEVASLKPSRPTPPFAVAIGFGYTVSGTTTLPNVRLAQALMFAFGLTSADQVAGPDWINSPDDLFEIVAKAPPATPPDRVRLMVLNLLTERFHLKLHHEQRELSFYALVVDKKGSKLKAADGGMSKAPLVARPGLIELRAPIPILVHALGTFGTGRPIVDTTGLKGTYDVKLEWSKDDGPTMADALPEQLGLRLDPRRGLLDVIVIDAANRIPDPN